jgi:hypothetical protein
VISVEKKNTIFQITFSTAAIIICYFITYVNTLLMLVHTQVSNCLATIFQWKKSIFIPIASSSDNYLLFYRRCKYLFRSQRFDNLFFTRMGLNEADTMRLWQPPDGNTSPKYKLLCFITTKFAKRRTH